MNIREAQKFSDKVVDLLLDEGKKKMSRYKISQISGLSDTALGYMERHERHPTLYSLKMIASAIDVKLSDILKKVEDIEE